MRKRRALLPILLALSAILWQCQSPEPVNHAWFAMDTEWGMYFPEGESQAILFGDSLTAQSEAWEMMLSDYRPHSILANLRGKVGDTVLKRDKSHAPLVDLLAFGEKLSQASGGALHLGLHDVKAAWGLGSGETMRRPHPDSLKILLGLLHGEPLPQSFPLTTGFHVDSLGHVVLTRPSFPFDLGGIAKGFVLDRMGAWLSARTQRPFRLSAGGDMRLFGKKQDKPWRIGIRHPRKPESSIGRLVLQEPKAISTSGDYERAFFMEGERIHHILDPLTGRPTKPWVSVTVLADSAVLSDALSTALMVLGPDQGMPLALQYHASALWLREVTNDSLCAVIMPEMQVALDSLGAAACE